MYIALLLSILILMIFQIIHAVSSKCKDKCKVQLSYAVTGSLTWTCFLIIRRLVLGVNIFSNSDPSQTVLESIAGGILWGVFFVVRDVVRKSRSSNEKHIFKWNGINFVY